MSMQTPIFDAELVARYDHPGPRYTSYPTAPQFQDGFGLNEWRAAIDQSNRRTPPRPLSLYIHIPIPHELQPYSGTATTARIFSRFPDYLESADLRGNAGWSSLIASTTCISRAEKCLRQDPRA